MRIISISSQKGGTGKTTTAAAIAQGAIELGYKPLLIDLDAQGSLTCINRANGNAAGSYELIKGRNITELIQHIDEMPDIIPASLQLAGVDAEFANRPGRDFLLKKALEPLKGYDFVIIDTAPALGTLLVNSLTAATEVIIPLQADTFALQGLYQLTDTIQQVKQYCNPSLQITGALLTRYSPRTIISRDLKEAIQGRCDALAVPLINNSIRDGVAVREAQTLQKSLFQYAPKSNPARDYMQLLHEIGIERK